MPAPLSPVDAAWLRMGDETNPMVITVMLTLDGVPAPRDLDELVERFAQGERFRQRIAPPPLGIGAAHWEDDPCFAPRAHVHRCALPSPGDERALADMVSDVMGAPLDPTRPLWAIHVIEGLPQGRSAILLRIHHCIADGLALVRLFASLIGATSPAPEPGAPDHASPWMRVPAWATSPIETARVVRKLLTLPADPATPLAGELSRRKRAAWSSAIPLDLLKRVAHAHQATVNDVLLAATSAALRRYLIARGAMRSGLEVHALVTMFLHDGGAPTRLGNHFGLVFAALPLACPRSGERLHIVKRRMDAIKASPEASAAFVILGAAGLLGAELERLVVDFFTRKASLMVTNVAGPPMPVMIAGRTLESVVVWAPTAGHLALGVSFFSYAGAVRIGIQSDAVILPDPEALVSALEHDLSELAASRREPHVQEAR